MHSRNRPKLTKPLARKQRLSFYRQLRKGLAAGVPVFEFLQGVRGLASAAMKSEVALYIRDLGRGLSLAQAAAKRPALFPLPVPQLIGLGEESGKLPAMLEQICRDLEEEIAVFRQTIKLLIYPAAILAVWVLLFPLTAAFLKTARSVSPGQSWPVGDLLIVYAGGVLENLLLLAAVIGAAWGAKTLIRMFTDPVKLRRFVESLPVIGGLLRKQVWALIANVLAHSVDAGLAWDRALALAASTGGNPWLAQKARTASRMIAGGKTFTDAVSATGLFPPEAIQAIRTGETTGTLEAALHSLCRDWRAELEHTMAILWAVLSKVVLVLLAIMVAIFVVRQYLRNLDYILTGI